MTEYFNENGPTGVPPQEQWSVDDIVRFESHAFAVQKVMDVFLRLVGTFLSLSVDFLIRWTHKNFLHASARLSKLGPIAFDKVFHEDTRSIQFIPTRWNCQMLLVLVLGLAAEKSLRTACK